MACLENAMNDASAAFIPRELTAHRVNGLNDALRIFVLDLPGSGGACHDYVVLVPSKDKCIPESPEAFRTDTEEIEIGKPWARIRLFATLDHGDSGWDYYIVQRIRFQNGPVKEAGYNGNSHEALLAILIDRLECFQKGTFAGRDNACALTKLDEARLWLHKRTMDRVSRGVEGTHQK